MTTSVKPLALDPGSPPDLRLEEGPEAYALTVPPHGTYDQAVRLTLRPSDEAVLLRVQVGEAARVRFVVDYPAASVFSMHMDLKAGAYADVFHLDAHPAGELANDNTYTLGEHASLNVWTFAMGADALLAHDVEFLKPHGFAALYGLSLLSGRAKAVHRVRARHRAGNCVSRQFYKSIVSAQARSQFESLVEVVRGAQKSDSKQLNKNLLLSKSAQAVSRPELRIDSDDVACAHGSATGELSQDEIFYARTRGIAPEQARFLMIEGFAGEILEELPAIPLKDDLSARVKGKIPMLAAA